MSSLHHVADPADVVDLTTTFLNSAAAIETRLHDATRQIASLQRELQRAQQRQASTRAWIMAVQRSHRLRSHAQTTKLIKVVLGDLDARDATPHPISLFPDTLAS